MVAFAFLFQIFHSGRIKKSNVVPLHNIITSNYKHKILNFVSITPNNIIHKMNTNLH